MKHFEQAQIPAQGILQYGDYGNSKFYRIACKCGNGDDDVQLNVEADEDAVTVHIWTNVKTAWWRRRFDEHDNFIIHYCLQNLNGFLNRISVAWTALTKGYVECESWTLMNKQEAVNFAYTLVTAVADVEDYENQRKENKNK